MMIGGLSMLGIMEVTLYVSLGAALNIPSALMIFSLVLVNLWWGAIICVYFLACIPLPPGKSKVQSWLESFQATPELKEAEVPVR